MTASELIEILKAYPPEVQVIIKINEETPETGLLIERPINDVYPYAYKEERAICICYEYEEEEEE